MRGWIDLGSDMDWIEHGGHWGRRTNDGSWFVIEWTNMHDAVSERECKANGMPKYLAELRLVLLREASAELLQQALACVGYDVLQVASTAQLVEAMNSYGVYAPLESFQGDSFPKRVRAQARRAAEAFMRDSGALNRALEEPVNAIGSTAREFGLGDILAGLRRYQSGEGPQDPVRDLMLKIHGAPQRAQP